MTYLDYSATTKVDDEVLKRFNKTVKSFYANPNSVHKEGLKAKSIIDEAINNITKILNLKNSEIIFTSGASESNNLAIKGTAYLTNKKTIITTALEHSSIITPLGYLEKQGYNIKFVKLDKNGKVDLEDLQKIIDDDTFLVSINAVNSEIGIIQPIKEIGKILKDKNIVFHSDMTQAIGKMKVLFDNVDLISLSGHKIYGFKGIGALIKNNNTKLIPLIHGGKSTNIYRSGTPSTELIDSLSNALEIIYDDFDNKYKYIYDLNNQIKNYISKYKNIIINSNKYCIPNILNISILGKNSNDTQEYFSDNNIMLSTKTACSTNSDLSHSVYEITNDEKRAISSIRISLSYKTTKEDLEHFFKVLDNYMRQNGIN